MLCPYCQHEVPRFEETADPSGGRLLSCPRPECREQNIPLLYPQDYASHPAVPVSIIGLTNHGKTVFISSLIQELERLGARWPGFHCSWLDETEVRTVRSRMQMIASGQLPPATRSVFPRPQILRLDAVPRVGGCQLVFYDTGGETFLDTAGIRESGRYVRNSGTVVWLISMKDLESPQELGDALTVYVQAMATMGADTRKQKLIITLTKGDLLLDEPDFPRSAHDFLLSDNLDPRTDSWERLEALSNDLEAWMLGSGLHNMVNLVKSRFRGVKYCIVSAQGAPATDQQLKMQLMPRGVLAPLFWLWRDRFPAAWVHHGESKEMYLSLEEAIKEAPPAATIRLEAGDYRLANRVELRQPVSILGDGMERTTLYIPAERVAFGIRTTGRVSLQGMWIERDGPDPGDVMRIVEGEVELINCRVQGGRAATGQAEGCGVIVAGESRATFSGCHFVRNAAHGLSVRDRATVTVIESRAAHNERCGFVWAQEASGSIQKSNSVDNRYGVRVQGSGAVMVAANRCSKNRRNGILVEEAGAVELHGNTCDENDAAGIDVIGHSRGRLSDNVCQKNKGTGISVGGTARVAVSGNQCMANSDSGIAMADSATAVVAGNHCDRNERSGITFAGSSSGECHDNQCTANGDDGLNATESSGPTLTNNTSRDNGRYGVYIAPTANLAKASRNTATGNKREDVKDTRKRGWFG